MPKGHFNIKVLDAKGLVDADFHKAQENDTLEHLLNELDTVGEYDQNNQLSHYLAGLLFYHIFDAPYPSNGYAVYAGNLFHYIGFGDDTEDFDYSYGGTYNRDYSDAAWRIFVTPSGNVSNADFKTTSSAIRTHKLIVEPDSSGLKAAYDTHYFLWTPSQAVSNSIRQIQFATSNDNDDNWGYYDSIRVLSRVRIKDANGNPQTISKTSGQVLLVQWTISLKIT